jgi:tetratricopeptide (TPR) repeat protein
MRSRSASRVSVCPIQRVLFGFVIFVLTASITSAQTSRSPNDLLKAAVAAHQAGKLEEAIEDYRSFLQSYPDVAPVRSDLGAALAGTGRYEEAIVEYKRALEFKSLPEVRLNLALAYYKTAKLSQAIAELEKVHQDKPAEIRPVLLLADCDLRLGDNKKVIELLNPLQKASPDDLAIAYMLGTALVRDGQADKGQVLIDKILKNGDSAEARLLLGTTKLMVSDFSGALVDLQKAVELNPNLPEVYAYYGTALLSTGDQAGALEAFKRALQDDPNNFESNLRMGMLLRKDEDFDGALPYLKHALEIRPGDLGVRYQIASMELARGNVEQARTQLESIVGEAPNFTEAHVSLATAYYREKKKIEGDRQRAIVVKLNADKQSTEKGAKVSP